MRRLTSWGVAVILAIGSLVGLQALSAGSVTTPNPYPGVALLPDIPPISPSAAPQLPGNRLALSFDDGPGTRTDPYILTTLERYHAHATFFVTGENMAKHPGLVRRALADGDAVGLHSYDHPDFSGRADHTRPISRARARWEIDESIRVYEQTTGRRPTLWRYPHNDATAYADAYLARRGLTVVVTDENTDSGDWAMPGAAAIERCMSNGVSPDSVVDLHDGYQNNTALGLAQLQGYLPYLLTNYPGWHYDVIKASTHYSALNQSYVTVGDG